MSNNSQASEGGIGLCGVLFVVFLVLKLVGVIDWSWWWVTAPLWLPTVVLSGIFGVVMVIVGSLTVLFKK